MNMKSLLGVFGAAVLAVVIASGASAGILTHGNSTVVINNNGSAVDSWSVDGVSQLFEQTFYIRVGATAETELNELNLDAGSEVIANLPTAAIASSIYSVGDLDVSLTYTLAGSGPGGGADLGELIAIKNTGNTTLNDIHFFQYVDFDLNGSIGGQSGFFPNVNAVIQSGGGMILSETVITPAPAARALEPFNTLEASLNDAGPTSLIAFNNGPLNNADVTWAFEWIFNLAPGAEFQISKDKNLAIVPAPLALPAGLVLLGLVAARRRRAA